VLANGPSGPSILVPYWLTAFCGFFIIPHLKTRWEMGLEGKDYLGISQSVFFAF
jgi:hypothetical protein